MCRYALLAGYARTGNPSRFCGALHNVLAAYGGVSAAASVESRFFHTIHYDGKSLPVPPGVTGAAAPTPSQVSAAKQTMHGTFLSAALPNMLLAGSVSGPYRPSRRISHAASFSTGKPATYNSSSTDDLSGQHQSPNHWAAVPPMLKTLGLLGIIPFIALSPPVAGLVPLMPVEVINHAATLQISYGISIVTFLGGVHWGLGMAGCDGKANSMNAVERYVWSVTPCLVAFPAAMLPPLEAALILTGTLIAAYIVDGRFAGKGLLPKWYMALRLPLTIGASTGMMVTVYHFLYLC